MYLHLGQDIVVKLEEIIGIFDLENASIEKATKNYLAQAQKLGMVYNVSMEIPKSFIVCQNKKSKKTTVYISQISSQTLKKRTGYIGEISNIQL